MKSIQELYEEAGSPDLSKWKLAEIYTIEHAALLCAGIDPDIYQNISQAQKVNLPTTDWALRFSCSLRDAALLRQIPLVTAEIQVHDYQHDEFDDGRRFVDTISIDTSKVNEHIDLSVGSTLALPALKKWAARHELNLDIDSATSPFHSHDWPAPFDYVEHQRYSTPALKLLNELIHRFWMNYDPKQPDTAKSSDTIMAWLTKTNNSRRLGFSDNLLKQMDSIARHPAKKKGGKPKRV